MPAPSYRIQCRALRLREAAKVAVAQAEGPVGREDLTQASREDVQGGARVCGSCGGRASSRAAAAWAMGRLLGDVCVNRVCCDG